MPKSKEALEQWLEGLKSQGKLDDQKLEAIRSALDTPEVQEYVGSSVLRQEDYSRLVAAAKAKEAEAITFQQSLADWKGSAETEYFDMQKKMNDAIAEKDRLEAIAKEYVPEADLETVRKARGEIVEPVKPVEVDLSSYLKMEDAQKAMIDNLKVQNRLFYLAAQHQKLFGEPLEDEGLIDRAIAANRTLDQEWEDKYKVADKRAELATQAQEAHDAKIREEERTKILSELKLPEIRDGISRSPVLADFQQKPVVADVDKQTGIQAALEAYSKGTYRANQS